MSLGEYTPKADRETDPSPPQKPVTKARSSKEDLEVRQLAAPIAAPTNEHVVSTHPININLGVNPIVVESVPSSKYVLLFGVTNRQLAKAYIGTGAKVRHLSLSEEEDMFILAQGLGISTFRAVIGQSLNPALTDGNTGLVVLGKYVNKIATIEQRATFAKSIAPVVKE